MPSNNKPPVGEGTAPECTNPACMACRALCEKLYLALPDYTRRQFERQAEANRKRKAAEAEQEAAMRAAMEIINGKK